MGSPKEFLSYHKMAESKRMYQLLERLSQGGAYYSLRSDQARLEPYRDARQIIDSHDGWGPLASLVDAFKHVKNSSWLVVPVDMPFLDKGDLQRLLNARTKGRGIIAFVDGRGVIAPMPAVYEHSVAQMARELIARGQRAIRALGDGTEILALEPENAEHLKNINTPRDSRLTMGALHMKWGQSHSSRCFSQMKMRKAWPR